MAFGLLFSLLLTASTVTHAGTGVDDTVSSGNYMIHLCNSGEPNSNASYLQDLLPQIYSNVQAVIADARLGIASKRGYGAFFKTDENIEEVIRVYQHIAAGSDVMIKSVPGSKLPGLLVARPTLVCINDVPETASIYHNCTYDYPDTPLVHWEGSDLIALCPKFWSEKQKPTARIDCPRLRGSALSPNSMALSVNQEAMIVHQLVHMYQNVTRYPDEKMNIQDAVDLSAAASLANANNYAFYYAGQYNHVAKLSSFFQRFISLGLSSSSSLLSPGSASLLRVH